MKNKMQIKLYCTLWLGDFVQILLRDCIENVFNIHELVKFFKTISIVIYFHWIWVGGPIGLYKQRMVACNETR